MFISLVPVAITYQNEIDNPKVPSFMFTVMELAFGGTPACLIHLSIYEEQVAWDLCYFSLLARAFDGLKKHRREDDTDAD